MEEVKNTEQNENENDTQESLATRCHRCLSNPLTILHLIIVNLQIIINYTFIYYFWQHNDIIFFTLCMTCLFCSHSFCANSFLQELDSQTYFSDIFCDNDLCQLIVTTVRYFLMLVLIAPLSPTILYLQTTETINCFKSGVPRVAIYSNKLGTATVKTKLDYVSTFPQSWYLSLPQFIVQTIFTGVVHSQSNNNDGNNNISFLISASDIEDSNFFGVLYYVSVGLFVLDVILKGKLWCYCVERLVFVWNMFCIILDLFLAIVSFYLSVYYFAQSILARLFLFKFLITFVLMVCLTCYMVFTKKFSKIITEYYGNNPLTDSTGVFSCCAKVTAILAFLVMFGISV